MPLLENDNISVQDHVILYFTNEDRELEVYHILLKSRSGGSL